MAPLRVHILPISTVGSSLAFPRGFGENRSHLRTTSFWLNKINARNPRRYWACPTSTTKGLDIYPNSQKFSGVFSVSSCGLAGRAVVPWVFIQNLAGYLSKKPPFSILDILQCYIQLTSETRASTGFAPLHILNKNINIQISKKRVTPYSVLAALVGRPRTLPRVERQPW